MSDSLITIRRFEHPFEAHICKAKLESEGIHCFLDNEDTMGMYPVFTIVGGVKLQVRESDVEEAVRILEDADTAD